MEVTNLNFSDCFFTWNNKSEGSSIVARKLDRVMVNEEWLCQFGRTLVDFPPRGVSDHSFAIISVGSMVSLGPKPFKFYNFWFENNNFMDWLSSCWSKEVHGVPMYRLCKKLKVFKAVLKSKTFNCYGNLRSQVI